MPAYKELRKINIFSFSLYLAPRTDISSPSAHYCTELVIVVYFFSPPLQNWSPLPQIARSSHPLRHRTHFLFVKLQTSPYHCLSIFTRQFFFFLYFFLILDFQFVHLIFTSLYIIWFTRHYMCTEI